MKKQPLDRDVYTLSLERIGRYYDLFDRVAVSFSGGKDSTVALMLTLQVAKERDRLPLDVVFWDEEAIPNETVEYLERVRQMDDVSLRWYCLPVQHRNGCSRQSPYWYPWDSECPERWCRALPECGITELAGFDRHRIPDMSHLLFDPAHGTTAFILGIRAQESLRRYRSVTQRIVDNDIAWEENGYTAKVKPIYDWTTDDVWIAPYRYGWDYNRSYDLMEKAGMTRYVQRIAPPFGEEPMMNLWMYSVCWPELWAKMIQRVPGAATAARYAQTELYGYGKMEKPDGVTWQEMIERFLLRHPPETRSRIAHRLKTLIAQHQQKTDAPLPAERDDPISGLSWKRLASIASRGDLKGRRGARF
jgi:predicted phosphoadenosine phosphosulfate sulfurtransferase